MGLSRKTLRRTPSIDHVEITAPSEVVVLGLVKIVSMRNRYGDASYYIADSVQTDDGAAIYFMVQLLDPTASTKHYGGYYITRNGRRFYQITYIGCDAPANYRPVAYGAVYELKDARDEITFDDAIRIREAIKSWANDK